MATRASSSVVTQVLSLHTPTVRNAQPAPRVSAFPGRRELLLSLSLTWTASVVAAPAKAVDIGLFGIKKRLKEAERETEKIVKEGFEAAEKGIDAAEKGIDAAEKGIDAAEKGIEAAEIEIETAAGFSGLAQAGVVVGAEVLGVLVASSVVNGILGPES